MAEEFDESEVVFSDNTSSNSFDNSDDNSFYICNNSSNSKRRNGSKKKKRSVSVSASVPVNIPGGGFELAGSGEVEEEECGGGGGIVPPHVVIGTRIQRKMAFSVCTGNGRTLKGRDLSQVRNSILRLTGFLEA